MKKSSALRIIIIILGCAALGGLFILGIFSNFGFLLARSTPFPLNMHSSTQANYQQDPDYMQIPPMDIQLVVDAIWDQNLDAQNLSMRLTQVNDNFVSAVASVTPRPTVTETTMAELTPSDTPSGLTAEVDSNPSSTPTETPVGLISSPTSITSTDTPPLPPTNTLSPPTNTASPCTELSISSFNTAAIKATWRVMNNSSTTVTLNSISITWPAPNGDLTRVLFEQNEIWSGTGPPTSIVISPNSSTLSANSTKKLDFFFLDQVISSGYTLTLNLSGCVISKSN